VAGSPPENLSDVLALSPMMDTSSLGVRAWELESDGVIALRKKLTHCGMPLSQYAGRKLLYGVKTGLNEVYLIDTRKRDSLIAEDESCSSLIRPFLRGQDIREWHCEWSDVWLLCMKSSTDHHWPWSDAQNNA
jgi:hypothetical protein